MIGVYEIVNGEIFFMDIFDVLEYGEDWGAQIPDIGRGMSAA